MFTYLTLPEIEAVVNSIHAATLYPQETRNTLLGRLPLTLAGIMPPPGAPRTTLINDIQFLNRFERIADGSVPLKAFLQGVIFLVGDAADLTPVKAALAKIDADSTGAPKPSLTGLRIYKERVIFTDDTLPMRFMEGGVLAARSIAKLETPRFENGVRQMLGANPAIYLGTGWIIAPKLLITNHHVFNARKDGEPPASAADFKLQTEGTQAIFDYHDAGVSGVAVQVGKLVASDPVLDYAIAEITAPDRAALVLSPTPVTLQGPDPVAVNIVQHPDGKPTRFGIRNNLVASATPDEIRYFTDTMGGSSGSPVFGDDWKVVGLHRGAAFADNLEYQGKRTAYVNLGSQLQAILAHVRQQHPNLLP